MSPHPPQQYQGWQGQQYQQGPPANSGYHNPLYNVASDVLGMGPPSGGPSMSRSMGPGGGPPMSSASSIYAGSVSSGHSGNSGNVSFNSSTDPYAAPSQIDNRPNYQRAGTSASLTPSSTKSKAVDLTAPPYTKEYIDQYRQRIKADPDPEAHFLYAKYLIDAAKHIRSAHREQKAAKKYTEVLVGESLKVIRRLATQGDAYDEAQFFLANCYGTGALGLQVDHERAYHLYLQAAKQNHAAASYRVAVCNEIGAGTKKEPARAAAFYRKAASLGDTPGMYKLGMILLHGLNGEAKNPREAISWLKRASEQADEENPHSVHELALLYENPSGQLVPYDPAYARSLLTQAGQLGYTPSQYKLGQCFEYGNLTCPVDPKRSIAWYTKAAEKGDSEAELALSGWYLTGSEGILKQSDSEAYLWARRAANKGLSKAEYAVGYYAEVGIGIKQDIEFAKKWYMRAAAQGNKRAMNRLTEMKRMGAAKRGNIARPTRQQDGDDCIIS
ncbi:HCP-like protein [Crepidotus variabilis]|uniref:HCP-like protein n=1 Tax=Crepidotus variabilis TaxID=179855 RepID=A0A9P6JSV3_9AGAR|nr:HCP-like protein [Crepidotus variabilis]